MADFLIGDVRLVRELNQEHKVNKHIADGWVLISAVTASSRESDGPVSRYILGWLEQAEPKAEHQY